VVKYYSNLKANKISDKIYVKNLFLYLFDQAKKTQTTNCFLTFSFKISHLIFIQFLTYVQAPMMAV